MMQKVMHMLFQPDRVETRGEILFFRIFEVVMVGWALWFGWEWGRYIPNIADVVLPLGIARFVDISFMFDHNLSIVNAGLMTAAALVGFFRLHRSGYLMLALFFHLQYVSRYSLGEISHGSNVVGLTAVALGLAYVAFREEKHSRRFALGVIIFFLGLGYTTAAMSKLIASGPLWVDGGHMWMWIQERTVDVFSKSGVVNINSFQQLVLDQYPLATAILTFGLLTELVGVLIWSPRFRPWVMTLLIAMHVGIFMSMQINFPANNAILFLLAYPWADVIDRVLGSSAPG